MMTTRPETRQRIRAHESYEMNSQVAGDTRRVLFIAFLAAGLFHGALIPFTHVNTYDAFIHMFFGDHYARSWFDPWEPRWYTGFLTVSYPPGTHMTIAALSHIVSLRAAFVVAQLIGIFLLTLGVYRFSEIWVGPRAAAYAALLLVFGSALSETVHIFGQLPTTFSLGIFLNAAPHIYRWIAFGSWRQFFIAVTFSMATTAAHHVTTLFGGVFFVVPLAVFALQVSWRKHPQLSPVKRIAKPFGRGLLLAVCMVAGIVITVFPYWVWSVNDPINQVPIPHGSRENFFLRPDLGFMFFLLPWGALLCVLPVSLAAGFRSRLLPLAIILVLCFFIGLGGTTPVARWILHGAFDILTLDRFTFWGAIIILPFVGLLLEQLFHAAPNHALRGQIGIARRRMAAIILLTAVAISSAFAAILPILRPTQPAFIDPAPLVQFLETDEHDRWRYLTLGFGDQFAYLSSQTSALSVDGNYHSARRLQELTRYSVERLENSKYLGVAGLGSLQQFLINAENYNLKYVFSNDAFYDPLLYFTGWNPLNRLRNGIVIWEKPDVAPLSLALPRRSIPAYQALMWGVLPPAMLVIAALLLIERAIRGRLSLPLSQSDPVTMPPLPGPKSALALLSISGAILALTVAAWAYVLWDRTPKHPAAAEDVIAAYYDALDTRQYERAYSFLDPETRPSYADVMLNWRWTGGLLASYSRLRGTNATLVSDSGALQNWSISLSWLSSLLNHHSEQDLRMIKREGKWYILPSSLRPQQAPQRIQRETTVKWNLTGRRQPRPESDLHRDRLDRPKLSPTGFRLVKHDNRYSVIGFVSNTDADPAHLTANAWVYGSADAMGFQTAGLTNGQRLLPAQSTGVRIDFEGVLSLKAEEARGGFDPALYIPPVFPQTPQSAQLSLRALTTATGFYSGIALNDLTAKLEGTKITLSGTAENTGTESAAIVRIVATFTDVRGTPLWVEHAFVNANIYPGQSHEITLEAPLARDIELISLIDRENIYLNGGDVESNETRYPTGTHIPLPAASGYAGAHIHVSTLLFDPLF